MRSSSLLLPLMLSLQACVYESAVPLGDPDPASFDEALIGDWLPAEEASELRTAADTQAALLHVRRGSGPEYAITRDRRDDEIRGRAFITEVDDVRFLNILDLDEAEPLFAFARYRVEGDTLRLQFIADRSGSEERGMSGEFATSAELRAAVRARLHDPQLYEEDAILLVRMPAVLPASR